MHAQGDARGKIYPDQGGIYDFWLTQDRAHGADSLRDQPQPRNNIHLEYFLMSQLLTRDHPSHVRPCQSASV